MFFRRAAILSLLLCGIALLSTQGPLARAQMDDDSQALRAGMKPSNITPPRTYLTTLDEQSLTLNNSAVSAKLHSGEESSCFLPPLKGIHSQIVGVANLKVQSKAQKDFEKSCRLLAEKKYGVAEKQLHAAAKKYPGYPALWVLLGQLLERRQELKGSRESCLRAVSANSNYVPAYLCLADVAAHVPDWNEVLKQSNAALALDPGNEVSYIYNAGANLNLDHMAEAEKSALKGAGIDKSHTDPRLHLLLAQIYEKKGDNANEIVQLKELLKIATQPTDIDMIKRFLASVEKEAGLEELQTKKED